MSKSQKTIFATAIAVAIICLSISVLSAGYERRFRDIIKDYDEIYLDRLKHYENENVLRCYRIDENIGFMSLGQGYEDVILIYAELSKDSVENIDILYHNETIGYGDLVVEDWFLQRMYLPYEIGFITVKNRKENANEVIAITGATITSDAVVTAINECAQIMEEIKDEED